MKLLTALLGLFGGWWAFLGIFGWVLAFAGFGHMDSPEEALRPISLIILLTSGYFVWWGWVFHTFSGRFPFVSARAFWKVSLIHHVGWVVYFLPPDAWRESYGPLFAPEWLIGNIVIAAVLLILRPWNKDGTALPDSSCSSAVA